MRRCLAAGFILLAPYLAMPFATPLLAQSKAKAENVPEIPYDSAQFPEVPAQPLPG